MTYCLAMMMDAGLVFAADSRTNAGMDSVSTFRKLHVFETPGERLLVVLSAGNLAITQAVMAMLSEGAPDDRDAKTLLTVDTVYDAARLTGDALRRLHDRDSKYFSAHDIGFNASFIVGGQIKGARMRLFQVYAAGNFIEATPETAYFQIGETKYGKPIIERVLTPKLDLLSAAKCALVSLDSTIRSNVSVAPPIDLLVYKRDSLAVSTRQWVKDDDPYFNAVRGKWGAGLRTLFDTLPQPQWAVEVE